MYKSTKIVKGFSTCFRQYKAEDTHCKYLHGYALSFKLVFRTEKLDYRNWVQDFGFLSRSTFKFEGMRLKDWFNYMFDHTTIISASDPDLPLFEIMSYEKVMQLRILQDVGCELFAELVFNVISLSLKHDLGNECILESVECIENENNSALFFNPNI